MNNLFFELIRVSLGIQKELSRIPTSEEWNDLLEISKKQALSGICGYGLQTLYKDSRYSASIPKRFLLQWVGLAGVIKNENQKVNKQSVKLIKYFSEQGFNCSILKGQGMAAYYKNDLVDLRLLRQSGDIDLWVGGGRKAVWSHIRKNFGLFEYDYKTVHPSFYRDTEVEIHWIPEILMNLIRNRRLQKFWKNHEKELYSDTIELPEGVGRIQIPSVSMNRFYILLHCYRHAFDSGVGLRQVMDYYFVLQQDKDKASRTVTMRLVNSFGLSKFAAAMMWVMKELFHMEDDYLLCAPNEKEGKFLLNEIMQTGNFGQYDERLKPIGDSKIVRIISTKLQRAPYLIIHYPMEVLWAPVWKIYHFIWKRTVGRLR